MGHCYNSCVVNASVDDVWAALRNFHNTDWAAGVLESNEPTGGAAADQIGAKRVLNGVFHETLIGLDDQYRTLQYTIDDGPGPLEAANIVRYVGSIRVLPVTIGERTFVEWQSNYQTASDADTHEFCMPIYQALLGALQAHFA